jgi:collagenase-like PrtC family protease
VAQPSPVSRTPELLAPAGDADSLRAALDAGADAVYFGLDQFNARRRARNFRADELVAVVDSIHAKGARAYLTLNTDLAEREASAAARILELAGDAAVDAVIVRDLAVLALRPAFPELAFHLSTQSYIASSADVVFARDLGVARVVLAREMSLPEIAAASAVPGIETEVFVQGALCFCISGRCLLSSWASGRSGNRGLCTSPCRLPWHTDDDSASPTPLSMLDLVTIDRLGELARAGVAAFKIEGRLKTAEWVSTATRLYRAAIDHPLPPGEGRSEGLLKSARALSSNTGRQTTSAYLDARRSALTGLSSRQAASRRDENAAEFEFHPGAADYEAYELSITMTDTQLQCRVVYGGRVTRFSIPSGTDILVCHPEVPVSHARDPVRDPRVSVRDSAGSCVCLAAFLDNLSTQPILNIPLKHSDTNAPRIPIDPGQASKLRDKITAAIRRTPRPDSAGGSAAGDSCPALLSPAARTLNPGLLPLGHGPDRVRLELPQALAWSAPLPPGGLIVEGVTEATLEALLAARPKDQLIIALPAVFFEEGIELIRRLLAGCAAAGVAVEAGNLASLRLAHEVAPDCPLEAGPGLAILNTPAAEFLSCLGVRCVSISVEADRRQIEDISANCAVPCSLTVFARPPLLVTRTEPPDFRDGRVYSNDRGLQLVSRRESGLWTFRPELPFDLRGEHNRRIRVAHLVVDLIASPDPRHDWQHATENAFLFNYGRSLA